jgi:signal transduction histidine kinase/DNA-binding response OmpR family regulator
MLMLFAAVILLAWVAQIRTNDFHTYHQSTAQHATTSVAVEIAQFVAEKKRLVELFGLQKSKLIRRFIDSPDDEQLYNELEEQVAAYFPNYSAFTVANANGNTYFEDFDGFVGEYCKDDIKHFAKNNSYAPRIHPNPEAYHFDIMASLGDDENSGVLLISFYADIFSGLLKSSQALGHDLMLIYPERKSLIEVTSDGARNHWDRTNYQLSQQEQDRILFHSPVSGTVWHATDLHKPDLFKQYNNNIIEQSLVIFSVFATIGFFTIIVIRKQERRREKSDYEMLIAKEQADIANKSKSDFLANMSHELRTPLNAIIGYSEMLEEDANEGGFTELTPDLGQIKHAGRHLLSLINEILDLSKIESGHMEIYLEVFDMDALVDEVVTTVQPLVEKNRNQLTVQRDEKLGDIRSDSTKIRQIIFNLISNATKFTENGEISVHLLKQNLDEQDFIKIDVKDTGIGMTHDQLNRIFQPFAQADSSTTRKYGGTGLGLAITQRFCTMLGGEINVTSESNKGTTFTVWLQTNLEDKNIIREQAGHITVKPEKHRLQSSPVPDERRTTVSTILVIDDDPNICNLVTRFLHKEGFNVVTAPNGKEGLRLAKQIKPQVITLDVMMPGMDGWATLKQLKSDSELKHIPVAMLTQLDERGLGFSLGADDYLFKPINWVTLGAAIKKWVRKKHHDPVIVVTDKPPLQQQLHAVLEEQGYRAITVGTRELAMRTLQKHPSSLIIFELETGDPKASEFMQLLRENEQFNAIPVVALTSTELGEQDYDWLAKESITSVFIENIAEQEQLINKIRVLLGTKDSRHEAA